jgi:DNA-binding transcriptional MerR regulator
MMSRAAGGRARSHTREREEPVRQFFSIGDVCTLTDLKPHVLRYWETQFKFLSPAKNRSGNRVYQRREVELILLVKQLLYSEKYTIEGARRKVDEHRKAGAIRTISRAALERETLEAMERDLAGLVEALTLEGRAAAAPQDATRDWDEDESDADAEQG